METGAGGFSGSTELGVGGWFSASACLCATVVAEGMDTGAGGLSEYPQLLLATWQLSTFFMCLSLDTALLRENQETLGTCKWLYCEAKFHSPRSITAFSSSAMCRSAMDLRWSISVHVGSLYSFQLTSCLMMWFSDSLALVVKCWVRSLKPALALTGGRHTFNYVIRFVLAKPLMKLRHWSRLNATSLQVVPSYFKLLQSFQKRCVWLWINQAHFKVTSNLRPKDVI